MRESVTAQVRLGERWFDAAVVDFMTGGVQITYEVDYVFTSEPNSYPDSLRALSLTLPLNLAPESFRGWPAILDDVAPGGAARRWWIGRLGLGASDERTQRVLLERGAIAPIGHVRIKEAVESLRAGSRRVAFSKQDVLDRDYRFLDYAQLRGASIGGSTGAGGEAPKLLLRCAGDRIWIDTLQETESPDAHYLVKFPRRTSLSRAESTLLSSEMDHIILESEHVYYRALHELDIDTIDVGGTSLEHNQRGEPSLWMPRFDVRRDVGERRLGVESLYSLVNAPPGTRGDHQHYLDTLHLVIVQGGFVTDRARPTPSDAGTALAFEYVRRDLLNVVFGNADNHGRNMSVLKDESGVTLAPVYDFAPMVMDPLGVARSTRWSPSLENIDGIDWRGVCEAQGHMADVEDLWERLRDFATALIDLDQRLANLGLRDETLEFAPIGLKNTNRKLRTWDLIQ